MSEYLEAILLGIVQGLTEFLPVSSSGHLELAKWILGDTATAQESFLMTVVLHFGTAIATVWVFRREILQILRNVAKPEGRQFIGWIAISMIPAGLVGLFLEEPLSRLFDRQIILVSICLLCTGLLMVFSDHLANRQKPLSYGRAWVTGIAQAVAILPGISRSGSTIFAGVASGLDRKDAAQFSFLMVLPLIFAKMGKDALDAETVFNGAKPGPLLLGFFASLVVGIFACRWMIALVKKARLRYFGYYCLFIGMTAIVVRILFH